MTTQNETDALLICEKANSCHCVCGYRSPTLFDTRTPTVICPHQEEEQKVNFIEVDVSHLKQLYREQMEIKIKISIGDKETEYISRMKIQPKIDLDITPEGKAEIKDWLAKRSVDVLVPEFTQKTTEFLIGLFS